MGKKIINADTINLNMSGTVNEMVTLEVENGSDNQMVYTAEPAPEPAPPTAPYTNQEIDAMDCQTLASNIDALSYATEQYPESSPTRSIYQQTLLYAQNRFSSYCNIQVAKPDAVDATTGTIEPNRPVGDPWYVPEPKFDPAIEPIATETGLGDGVMPGEQNPVINPVKTISQDSMTPPVIQPYTQPTAMTDKATAPAINPNAGSGSGATQSKSLASKLPKNWFWYAVGATVIITALAYKKPA